MSMVKFEDIKKKYGSAAWQHVEKRVLEAVRLIENLLEWI